MEKKKRNSQNSATFKIGAISLIFLIIGYQAAVFIHRSAILKIEALRDNPDTVYIVKHSQERMADTGDGSSGEGLRKSGNASAVREGTQKSGNAGGPGESFDTVRRYAGHSRIVRAVRAQTRKAESFRFNPNEAPVEDLVRLGFSEKQAASIDNYRKKGGRFRRKSDFAKSFVVSDSIFRRLEPYIDIPLTDINSADSAAFDALPGIGPYFAAKMVEYRRKLGGYSHTEQLMDIYNFDREKYDSLKDLICCSPPQPYPLWTLPEDSLRLHPYVGGRAEARGIVRFRDNSPADSLTVEALSRAGVLPEERAAKLARCRIAAPSRD